MVFYDIVRLVLILIVLAFSQMIQLDTSFHVRGQIAKNH